MIFGAKNEVPLTGNDLISVILTFPACLVAAADGLVDEQERMYLLSISEGLGDDDCTTSDKARLFGAERYRAFMWLLNERENCEEKIVIYSMITMNKILSVRHCTSMIQVWLKYLMEFQMLKKMR